MPYAQSPSNGYITCFIFDGTNLHKIVIDVADKCIITAFKISKAEVLHRANTFNSVELLSIATYGEIVTDQKELYYAVKLLNTSPNVENNWLKLIGIPPQTRQTVVRRLEAELKAEPITRTIIQ